MKEKDPIENRNTENLTERKNERERTWGRKMMKTRK